jgi:hypothetical protein
LNAWKVPHPVTHGAGTHDGSPDEKGEQGWFTLVVS